MACSFMFIITAFVDGYYVCSVQTSSTSSFQRSVHSRILFHPFALHIPSKPLQLPHLVLLLLHQCFSSESTSDQQLLSLVYWVLVYAWLCKIFFCCEDFVTHTWLHRYLSHFQILHCPSLVFTSSPLLSFC